MSKFVKSFLLLILLIVFCTNCAFAATYPCEGQVLKNAVNVRKKASQGSDQVGKLKRDEIVTVIGEETSGNTIWYRIEFGNGNTGYVRGDLIELNEISVSPSTETPKPEATSKKLVEVLGPSIAGTNVDSLIDGLDLSSETMFGWISCTVSEDEMIGKPGSVYIDWDRKEIRMIGDNKCRKYSFGDDAVSFVKLKYLLILSFEHVPMTEYGVELFEIKEHNVKLLTEEDISKEAIYFINEMGLNQ